MLWGSHHDWLCCSDVGTAENQPQEGIQDTMAAEMLRLHK